MDQDQLRSMRLLNRHDCQGHKDSLSRENCGACVLNGYAPKNSGWRVGVVGPNYAGWARVYVQARRVVPLKWKKAFYAELASDNTAYATALQRDIDKYGLSIGN